MPFTLANNSERT